MKILHNLLLAALTAALLSGCVRVYKLDIQQGNDLDADQVQSIKVGMNRQEIRSLLGTPLIDDPFRAGRWDYYYAFRGGKSSRLERRQLSLKFENDVLTSISGGLETEEVKATQLDLEKLDKNMKKPRKDAEEETKPGFWARLKQSLGGDDEESGE